MDYFDLHCDTFTVCADEGMEPLGRSAQISFDCRGDIENWCELFAVFIDDKLRGEAAFEAYSRYVGYIKAFCAAHGDLVRLCRDESEVSAALDGGRCAGVLSVESSAALGGRLDRLDALRADGVRAMSLTWNGENEFARGCGAGGPLKEQGRALVDGLIERGIAPDVSHLSDEGVDEVLGRTDAPVIATHSNIRAMCANPRNLTRTHFCEIARRGGLVGMNLFVEFIRADRSPSLCDLLSHAYEMLSLGGESCLCMGSDFDGATTPTFCRGIWDIPSLYDEFAAEFGAPTAHRIFYENARGFFSRLMV